LSVGFPVFEDSRIDPNSGRVVRVMLYDDLTTEVGVKIGWCVLPKSSASGLSLFKPLVAPRGLTAELVDRLTADITSGKLAPGSRLPTEQEMIAATGVSRTVVREAVAALRAERLVITRQGVGAFVAESVRRPFRIDLEHMSSLNELLDVMELRTALEIEAAGLAADRASAENIRKISVCYDAIGNAIQRSDPAVDQDFAFHCAIADATGNPQFKRFLEYLGRFVIPRQTVWGKTAPVLSRTHLDVFQKEHRTILQAIQAGAALKARAAMRRHLVNSRKRHEKLARMVGLRDDPARS
jgi:DNA-binding FadR family transcriptional regulator